MFDYIALGLCAKTVRGQLLATGFSVFDWDDDRSYLLVVGFMFAVCSDLLVAGPGLTAISFQLQQEIHIRNPLFGGARERFLLVNKR